MTAHTRGDVTISLDKVSCEFYGYVDLMYPLELVVDDGQACCDPRIKKNTYRVAFYQRGLLVAVISSVVAVIEIKQFNRFRNLFMYEKNAHRYAPIQANRASVSLLDEANNAYPAECVSISRDACITRHGDISLSAIRSIRVSGSGFTFSSSVELHSQADSETMWQFPSLTQAQLMNLGAIIKRGFKHQTQEVYS